MNEKNCFSTSSGSIIDIDNLRPNMIKLQDIAHSLSNICRFGGHCSSFYSVATHSLFVCELIKNSGGTQLQRMQGLLHDTAEAYIGDFIRPLKQHISGYEKLEEKVLDNISEHLNVDLTKLDPIVKRFDNVALAIESKSLMNDAGFTHNKLIKIYQVDIEDYHIYSNLFKEFINLDRSVQVKKLFVDKYLELLHAK